MQDLRIEPRNPESTAPKTEEPEGLDQETKSWGEYPIDEMLIRHESRTVFDVIRRMKGNMFVMNPDFQRDFIWSEDKQSKLIESVIMRIPLPVIYLAEDDEGRSIVVDGLQRLSTFKSFLNNDLKLRLDDRPELDGKRFSHSSYALRASSVYILWYGASGAKHEWTTDRLSSG